MLQPSKETSSQWRSESPNKDQSQRGGVDEHGLLLVHKSVGLHIIGGPASQQISPLLEQLPLSELLVPLGELNLQLSRDSREEGDQPLKVAEVGGGEGLQGLS